jgi:hypothetical protein
VFLAAWTFDYWQAWIFLAVFSGSALTITLYLMKNDPALLARRMQAGPGAEKQNSQKIIQAVAMVVFIAALVFPAIDHRFAWSTVPGYVAIGGDILVAFGFLVVFFVFRENTFTSGVIGRADGARDHMEASRRGKVPRRKPARIFAIPGSGEVSPGAAGLVAPRFLATCSLRRYLAITRTGLPSMKARMSSTMSGK